MIPSPPLCVQVRRDHRCIHSLIDTQVYCTWTHTSNAYWSHYRVYDDTLDPGISWKVVYLLLRASARECDMSEWNLCFRSTWMNPVLSTSIAFEYTLNHYEDARCDSTNDVNIHNQSMNKHTWYHWCDSMNPVLLLSISRNVLRRRPPVVSPRANWLRRIWYHIHIT